MSRRTNSILSRHADYFEYNSAMGSMDIESTNKIEWHEFNIHEYNKNITESIPLDLSSSLGCTYLATAPSLLANYIKIKEGDCISINENATSFVFFIYQGSGFIYFNGLEIPYFPGDLISIPGGGGEIILSATKQSLLYHVNDSPILNYLGVRVSTKMFPPTIYQGEKCKRMLNVVMNSCQNSNIISVILGNDFFSQTRSLTHSLWAMFSVLKSHSMQKPHRHQSISLNFISDTLPGAYTLIGTKLNKYNQIVNPEKIDWIKGAVFVTPPGYWHAHFNESDSSSHMLQIQDAGLHSYLRTLELEEIKG